MLLYFKPGSHPWDTRIQASIVDWCWCTGVVVKIVIPLGNDFIDDHGDAAKSELSPITFSDEQSHSLWLTVCQCEE